MSKVSVIIPNFNNAAWLPRVVGSCMEQDLLLEVIVVDDHSTDDSIEVLQRIGARNSKLRIFQNPSKGGNAARVFGFEQSSGEFIQWLDSDDFLLPGKFRIQVTYLEGHPETDIVFSDWQMDFYENGDLKGGELMQKSAFGDPILELLRNRSWNANCAYLCRREVVARTIAAEGWNPATVALQDREFFTKAAILGAKFAYVAGNVCVYNRWNSRTVSFIDFRKSIEQSYKLNHSFYDLLKDQVHISQARRETYERVLNSELLTGSFYHPSIRLNRVFPPSRIDWETIHWKLRLLIPFLYLWKHLEYVALGRRAGAETRLEKP